MSQLGVVDLATLPSPRSLNRPASTSRETAGTGILVSSHSFWSDWTSGYLQEGRLLAVKAGRGWGRLGPGSTGVNIRVAGVEERRGEVRGNSGTL